MVRKDGTVQAQKLEKLNADVKRYLRFMHGGESIVDIAKADGLDPDYARQSITRGRDVMEVENQIRLRSMKMRGAIRNESMKERLREEISQTYVDAIKHMLSGKKDVVEVDKITGAVTVHTIIDPEVIAMGLEAVRKTISIEERPAAVNVNIQNNQQNINETGSGGGLTYEERLQAIHRLQEQGPEPIDVEARIVEEAPAQSVEAEIIDGPEKPEGDWKF